MRLEVHSAIQSTLEQGYDQLVWPEGGRRIAKTSLRFFYPRQLPDSRNLLYLLARSITYTFRRLLRNEESILRSRNARTEQSIVARLQSLTVLSVQLDVNSSCNNKIALDVLFLD